MQRIRISVIIGTRPEAIKLAPVILAARARKDEFEVRIVRTGQHRSLVDALMDEFGLLADDDLNVMRPDQDLAHVMAESVRGLSSLIARDLPDWVLVQGDTTTTFAGALAAFYNRVRIGHVEAGLRTGRKYSPFPEEANRALTARIADLNFAPTAEARHNLLREGIPDERILVVGNTVVDALGHALGCDPLAPSPAGERSGGASGYLLVTAHRRENHGPALERIADALLTLLERHGDLAVWIPMHPHPAVRSVLAARLGRHPRVRLTEPMGYRDFIKALHGAALVLSDSGGVQEECTALGKPLLVLRTDTERPEAVGAGVAIVAGVDTATIVAAATRLLDDAEAYHRMARPSTAFGDGRSSMRILDAVRRASAAGHRDPAVSDGPQAVLRRP